MKVEISRTVREALLAFAAADPLREVCGLLFGDANCVETAILVENTAYEPAETFEIDPIALISAHRSERAGGPRLIGYFHSHPNGLASPSATDQAMAAPDNRLWIIIASNTLTAWRSTSSGFVQYGMN